MITSSAPAQESDPWNDGNDPWSQFRPPPGLSLSKPGVSSVAVASTAKIDQLREELQGGITEMVQKQVSALAGSATQHEARLTKLETGMNELRLQNNKFEDWFSKFGQQASQTSAQVQEVTKAVAHQKQEITHLHGEVAKQSDTLQGAVGQLQRDLNQQISAQLSAQLEQIQGLLTSKKPRNELALALCLQPVWTFLLWIILSLCGSFGLIAERLNAGLGSYGSGGPGRFRPCWILAGIVMLGAEAEGLALPARTCIFSCG